MVGGWFAKREAPGISSCFHVAAVAGVAEPFETRQMMWRGIWRKPQQLSGWAEQLPTGGIRRQSAGGRKQEAGGWRQRSWLLRSKCYNPAVMDRRQMFLGLAVGLAACAQLP